MIQAFLIAVFLAAGASGADGDSLQMDRATAATALRQALTHYETAVAMKTSTPEESRKLFTEAANGFRSLIDAGFSSAGLHYNLANTQVRLGRVGPAIVNYRRALRLEPGNERIQRNLDFARSRCQTPIAPPALSQFAATMFSWHYHTAFSSRLTLAVAGYVLFWLLLIAGRWFRYRAGWIAWVKWPVAALALVLLTSVAVDSYQRSHVAEGVLTADSVMLRKGYGENYDPQLDRPLSDGVEVRIRETRRDVENREWFYVELPDGKGGWLRADQCTVI